MRLLSIIRMKTNSKDYNVEIIDSLQLKLLGVNFYGNPFHSSKGWTYENEIGILWSRFMKLSQKYQFLLEKINNEKKYTYELHYEPEEYSKSQKYHVFVGISIEFYDEIPLDFIIKPLPISSYAHFVCKVIEHEQVEEFIRNWTSSKENKYKQSYPYLLQRYSENYKGLDDPNSEIEWLIPVMKK